MPSRSGEHGTGRTGGAGVVTVRALGFLARYLPGEGPLRLAIPPGEALTVSEVMRRAGLPDEEVYVIIVNGARGRLEQSLGSGDEVTFVPPVAGG